MPFTDGFLLLWSLILLGVGTLTVPSSTQTHRRPIINNQRSLARMGCTFHRRLASYLVTNLLGVGTYTVYTRQSLGVTNNISTQIPDNQWSMILGQNKLCPSWMLCCPTWVLICLVSVNHLYTLSYICIDVFCGCQFLGMNDISHTNLWGSVCWHILQYLSNDEKSMYAFAINFPLHVLWLRSNGLLE